MRHLLLALMIVLLPIRGWMGDAMALSMLAAPAQAEHHQAAPGTDHAAHAQGGHHQDAAAMADPGAGPHHDGGAGGHTHKSCEVCNGPAMALSVPAVPALSLRHGLLALRAERFLSSEPHQGIKPPIS